MSFRAWNQTLPKGSIVPGNSVAGVKLGSSLADFTAVFPKHNEGDQSLGHDLCSGESYQWLDLDIPASGVFVYLRDDKIYQFRVQTPRFALANGLKVNASEEKVKRLYPGGRAYVRRYSDSKVVGGRDLRYWVDDISGIAFELYWDQRYKRRFVRSIDVFRSGTEYKPEGCIAPPQEWWRYPLQQLHFSAEDRSVNKPVTIPPDVLAMLKKDEMVGNVLESENTPVEKIPLEWFSAAEIHLSNARHSDLLVMATGPLAGGNVVTFWVFRATTHGYELALTAPAHDLILMNTRWKGYRDIELVALTAVQYTSVLCRFDGERYKKYKVRSRPIR
ncbi:MAG TPA: hypothetical protein VF532_01260 [Candidatus Angelobacter sp.]